MREIYTTPEYFVDITERIGGLGAGDRVALASMAFSPEYADISVLVEALVAAARRGAEVRLAVDAYTFLLSDAGNQVGPLFFSSELGEKLPRHYQLAREALHALEAAGGRYTVLNRPYRAFSNPFAGRSHIKFTVINDRLYLGGCNLNDPRMIDMMTGWDDRRTAQWLWDLSGRMLETGHAGVALGGDDLEYVVDSTSSLVVDAGISGRSLIFEKALEIIDAAQQRVLITCQFFPNDVTAKHLLKAYQRGVQVEIVYNHPAQHPVPNNLLHHGVVQAARLTLPKSFFVQALPRDRQFLHAKLIVTEAAAMIGSHNYVTAGVRLGTAEMALLETDPEFGLRAVERLWRQIAAARRA